MTLWAIVILTDLRNILPENLEQDASSQLLRTERPSPMKSTFYVIGETAGFYVEELVAFLSNSITLSAHL